MNEFYRKLWELQHFYKKKKIFKVSLKLFIKKFEHICTCTIVGEKKVLYRDWQIIICCKLPSYGQTFNLDLSCQQLDRLKEAQTQPALVNRRKIEERNNVPSGQRQATNIKSKLLKRRKLHASSFHFISFYLFVKSLNIWNTAYKKVKMNIIIFHIFRKIYENYSVYIS